MATVEPYPLAPRRAQGERRTFETPGEEPITLTLRRGSFAIACAAGEEAEEMVRTFIEGNDVRGPAPLPFPGVPASRALFRNVATLSQMQCPTDPSERIPTLELIRLSEEAPINWALLMEWFQDLCMEVVGLGKSRSPIASMES